MASRWLAPIAATACLLISSHVRAAPVLDCREFESRLHDTIKTMGEFVAQPGPMIVRYESETGKLFDWGGIAGLTGTLTCSKANAFEDFGIAVDEAARASDELPLALDRFSELASASVCTLSDGAPAACRALVKRMKDDTLAQFRNAVARGEAVPAGTADYVIVSGADAEIDISPVGITWSIGPGQSATMASVRQTFEPKNMDR